jgi:putative tricarboxylic transport membrane protein
MFFYLPFVGVWALFVRIPYKVLSPLILVFCILGAFSINNNVFDVEIMLAAGIFGYMMKKLDFPIAPMVITLILGPQMERALAQTLEMSAGKFEIIFTRPISVTLLITAMVFIIGSAVTEVKKKRGSFVEDMQ